MNNMIINCSHKLSHLVQVYSHTTSTSTGWCWWRIIECMLTIANSLARRGFTTSLPPHRHHGLVFTCRWSTSHLPFSITICFYSSRSWTKIVLWSTKQTPRKGMSASNSSSLRIYLHIFLSRIETTYSEWNDADPTYWSYLQHRHKIIKGQNISRSINLEMRTEFTSVTTATNISLKC
jgi:hypothetical protein